MMGLIGFFDTHKKTFQVRDTNRFFLAQEKTQDNHVFQTNLKTSKIIKHLRYKMKIYIFIFIRSISLTLSLLS